MIMFGAIDCAVHGDLCRKLEVPYYPQLRVWHFPDISESEGDEGFAIPTGPSPQDVDTWLSSKLSTLHRITPRNLPPPVNPGNGTVAPPPMQIADTLPTVVSSVHHLNDAEVGLLFSFRQSVFLQSEKKDIQGERKTVLKQDTLKDLLLVLDYLAVAFPSAQARTDLGALAVDVRELVEAGDGHLEYDAWSQALNSRSLDGIPAEAGTDPGKFWRLCRTYTCSLWTLFHIIVATPAPIESEQEPLSIVNTFVRRFFGCEDCVKHFTTTYDSCDFDRCKAGRMDQKNSSLWLWKVHNAVTQRVARERDLPDPEKWPSAKACPSCWDASREAVNDEIDAYLRQCYWRDVSRGTDSQHSRRPTVWYVLIIAFVCVCGFIGWSLYHRMAVAKEARSADFTARLRAGDHERELSSQMDPDWYR